MLRHKLQIRADSKFVVQNTFRVKPYKCCEFEQMWKTRESFLQQMPGFITFELLKNKEKEGNYISQTMWKTRQDFSNWLNSEEFEKSHGLRDPVKMAAMRAMVEENPEVSFYETFL